MMSVVANLLFCILPVNSEPVRDSVDAIEINHVCDPSDGRLCFTQLIFWRWEPWFSHDDVQAWRMRKCQHLVPHRTATGWRLTFEDSGILRIIDAPNAVVRWDLYDREIEERGILPEGERRQLSKPIQRARATR